MVTQLWCDRKIAVRVEGPDGARTVVVNKPYARIGSHPQAEVTLAGAGIPRVGLYLHANNQGIFCLDLARSRNSVLAEPGFESGLWLSHHRGAVLGDYRIYATFADNDIVTDDTRRSGDLPRLDDKGSAAVPTPLIVVLVNDQRRATYRINRTLTLVGRDVPSALRLKSEFISTTHCVLFWEDNQLWFVDLLSSNGTEKRGRRREAHRLRLGKTIKLGDVRLGFARTCTEQGAPTLDEATESEEQVRLNANELAVASVSDSRATVSSSGSSLATIDHSDSSLVEHQAVAATITTDSIEAITEMQRQLEKERTEWEEQRDQQKRALERRYKEIDQHFADIQSWRAELDVRSGQLNCEFSRRNS